MRDVLRSDLSDLESALIAVFIGTAVLTVVLVSLVLSIRLLPGSAQERIGSMLTRWSDASMELLGRSAYPWAVLMVITMGLMLFGAIVMLFVPR